MIKENKQHICKSLREFKKEFFKFINGEFKESAGDQYEIIAIGPSLIY